MAKSGMTYIYDSHDNALNIDSLYRVIKSGRSPIRLITFSNRELKLINL